jgi:hypothetical protein
MKRRRVCPTAAAPYSQPPPQYPQSPHSFPRCSPTKKEEIICHRRLVQVRILHKAYLYIKKKRENITVLRTTRNGFQFSWWKQIWSCMPFKTINHIQIVRNSIGDPHMATAKFNLQSSVKHIMIEGLRKLIRCIITCSICKVQFSLTLTKTGKIAVFHNITKRTLEIISIRKLGNYMR